MAKEINITADDIPFDFPKEKRLSLSDSRDIITIEIDRMGAGFRAVINGTEFELPPGLDSMEEAGKAAIQIAIAEISVAAKELIDRNFE
jgi:hypothetical protein